MDEARDAIADPDDAPVVAALAREAPIVSGDAHFHPLRRPVAGTLRFRDL